MFNKVLIIDDFEMMRSVLSDILKELEIKEIVESSDGAEAFNIINNSYIDGNTFDLIISDWTMPELDGVELFIKLQENENFREIPFILATAENETSKVLSAISKGIKYYVVKPYNLDSLKEKFQLIKGHFE